MAKSIHKDLLFSFVMWLAVSFLCCGEVQDVNGCGDIDCGVKK